MDYKKVFKVEWLDSCASSEWHRTDHQDYSALSCTTYGFVVEDTSEYIAIAQSHTTEGQVSGVMSIPKKVLISVTEFVKKD